MRADSLGFPITLDVSDAVVVIIGDDGDADAARKEQLAAAAGARVRRVLADAFVDGDCDGARLVLLCRREAALAARVAAAARARAVLVWCSDAPAQSDLAMPAVARLGEATLAVATGGRSPALASRLRAALEQQLGERFARFVRALGERRAAARSLDERRQDVDGVEIAVEIRYPDWFQD
jgi:precorrin-2 dehydrogenase/sirohydrochlorin ferrochelatase